MKNEKKTGKIIPKLKKELKNFCFSEEANIDKKKVTKIGVMLAMLTMLFEQSGHTQTTHNSSNPHTNSFFVTGRGGHGSGGVHSSHNSHNSHGSHGSHGQW